MSTPPSPVNPNLPTGEIEIHVQTARVLNESKTPPFYINDPDAPVDEILRLKYRYLDIRRQPMAERLLLRSRMVQAIREAHHKAGFVEVETPVLQVAPVPADLMDAPLGHIDARAGAAICRVPG